MSVRVYLDRIEGDRAVLVFGQEGRETASIPASALPTGTKEGAALDLSLSPAPEDNTHAEVQNLMDDLFSESAEK